MILNTIIINNLKDNFIFFINQTLYIRTILQELVLYHNVIVNLIFILVKISYHNSTITVL